MIYKCPGQDKRNITTQILKCSKCGYAKEIFSDEVKSKCPECGNISYREVLPTCIDWCKHAKDCVGVEAYAVHVQNKSLLLKGRLKKTIAKNRGHPFSRDISSGK